MVTRGSRSEMSHDSSLSDRHSFNLETGEIDNISIKKLIDTTSSTIDVSYCTPTPAYSTRLPTCKLLESLRKTESSDISSSLLDIKPDLTTVVHRCLGLTTSRRINSFYGISGDISNSIYSLPYESTLYSYSNVGKRHKLGNTNTNSFRFLEYELINSMDHMHIYNNDKARTDTLVVKPCGILNAGLEGLILLANSTDDTVEISCKTAFKVYPSSLFYKDDYNSDHYIYPYQHSNIPFSIYSAWHGCTLKHTSGLQDGSDVADIMHKDYDLLEVKIDNKSISSSIIYSRNICGLFISRYYSCEDGWQLEPLNNISYKSSDKIYYMSVSPYIYGECLMLKSNHVLLLYDVNIRTERNTVKISNFIDNDIIQTLCYGMNPNVVILGGNKLYTFDLRTNEKNGLILEPPINIVVTGTKWTERHYPDSKNPYRHSMHLLSGQSSSFSNYWMVSKFSYWGSFTACCTHPNYPYLLATIYTTGNCIYIFDLRMPDVPILEIPLPSSEIIGARFRHLIWSIDDNAKVDDTILTAFCWKYKHNICCSFVINPSCTQYTCNSNNDDNISIKLRGTRLVNIGNVNEKKERKNFTSIGPLIESLDQHYKLPLHFPQESSLTNIFHGYLGMTLVNIYNRAQCKLLFTYTTSGKLLCIDLGYRNIEVKRTKTTDGPAPTNCNIPQIDLHEGTTESGFEGFKCTCERATDVIAPSKMKFDRYVRNIKISFASINDNKQDCVSIRLPKILVDSQESLIGNGNSSSPLQGYKFCNEFNTDVFNSMVILHSVFMYKRSTSSDLRDKIISLSHFEDVYNGRDQLEDFVVNVWDCNDLRIDYDYQFDNINNPFFTTSSCSCALIPDTCDYRNAFFNALRQSKSILNKEHVATDTCNIIKSYNLTTQRQLIYQSDNDKLTIEEMYLKSVGNRLLFHSPRLPRFEDGQISTETPSLLHNEHCGINNLISVKLKSDEIVHDHGGRYPKEDEAAIVAYSMINDLLSTWKLTPPNKESQNEIGGGIRRCYKPQSQIEVLKTTKEQQNRMISQLLQNANKCT